MTYRPNELIITYISTYRPSFSVTSTRELIGMASGLVCVSKTTPLLRMILGALLRVLLTFLFTEGCYGQTGTVVTCRILVHCLYLINCSGPSFFQKTVPTGTLLTPLHAIVILELVCYYHVLCAVRVALLKCTI